MKHIWLLAAVIMLFSCTYEESKYRVYYHGNGSTGGDVPKDSKYYSSGETATLLDRGNLVKNDYTFLGWRYYDTMYYVGDKITIRYDDINVYAAWDDGYDSPFSFTVDNGEVTITRYNEQNTSTITIPETLQSKPVTAIDNNVFSNLSISAVSLPKNLKNIGIGAFANNRITQLIIPDSVESIGLGAFRNNSLKKVTFGTGIDTIAPYSFANNLLTDVTIPANILTVEAGAFNDNTLDMVIIGAGVDIKNDTSMGLYGDSFLSYYSPAKLAGIYIYIGSDTWERH